MSAAEPNSPSDGGQSPPQVTRDTAAESIWGLSFQGLLWTNWLTAINDNISRWYVIGLGKQFLPADQHAWVLVLGTAFFVLPYLIFAVPAGWLADRFSKRQVIVACKYAEIVIMMLAILAIWCQSFEFLLGVVFLMGAQSALFAPAKVGTIPELLDERQISAGNGLFNLATLSATIIGMSLGAWLSDITAPRGTQYLWLAAVVMIGIAVIGTVLSLFVTRLPAANPGLKFPVNAPRALWRDFRELWRNRPLFRVALGVVFFWSFASLAQINIDAFVDESGSAWDQERIPLLISLVLGVGFGSVLAGFASRGQIELGLVPWAVLGMVVFAGCLALTPAHFLYEGAPLWKLVWACAGLAFLGIAGGFYDVPLASYLQERSPPESRGAVLAAANFLLFSGVLLTMGVFYGLRVPVGEPDISTLPAAYNWPAAAARQGWNETEQLVAWEQAIAESSAAAHLELKERLQQQFPGATSEMLEAMVDAVQIGNVASEIPESERGAAVAQLIFRDIPRRIAAGRPVDPAAYAVMLNETPVATAADVAPVNLRLIKTVTRAARPQPFLSSRQVFGVMSLFTILVAVYAIYHLAQRMAIVGFYWLVRVLYRWRVVGLENVPAQGPMLVIANHSSWIDATLMMLSTPHYVRPIAWAGNFNHWFMRWFGNLAQVILISGGPKSIARGLAEARQILRAGGIVGLFPEGGLSRNVQVKAFKPGILKLVEDSKIPILPMYIDQVWGSIFSFSGGKAIWKLPRSFRRGVSVHIGPPLIPPVTLADLRFAVQNLGAEAVKKRVGPFVAPPTLFIRACRKRLFRFKVGDSTGQKMTGGELLMRTLILRRLLRRHVLKVNEKNVGVLIPPSVGGVVVNMALALDRRVSVNLNYSVSPEIMEHCLADAQIEHVLTTEKVMEKFEFNLGDRLSLLDQIRPLVRLSDKIVGALQAYLFPSWLLILWLGLRRIQPDDLLTLIFTSGSTGKPKGVMLTQQNIASNVMAIDQVVNLTPDDVITGVLPFFHSFGYTVSMWGALGLNVGGAYHFSPLDARQVGKLVETYGGTLLLATPTFLRNYLKRCTPEEFKSLQIVVVGAEKMPIELADEFEKKFGVRPVEGYGATELSPLVSVNIPPSRRLDSFQIDCKEGTVGRPIPNVVAKITDLDSGAVLPPNQPGMLWIKGPNVMAGYLNHPEKTAETVVEGWYRTGDVGFVDDDGFIKLTGRISRFSKIGGEMVPHVAIEDELLRLVGDSEGEPTLAVTAVADPRKGERLIVLYTQLSKPIDELRAGLSAAGMPNLFIPAPDGFVQVDQIPILGSGKVDLKALKDLAEARAGE